MLFRNPPKLASKTSLLKYLETELWTWAREIATGLNKLNFTENFESFRVDDLEIKNGEEVFIPNGLQIKGNNTVPSSRIIVRQLGNGLVTDGDTPWDAKLVYLKNQGPDDVTISVIFFK